MASNLSHFNEHIEALRSICERRHVSRLDVFGSALGAEFGEDSDIDFLVEFEPLKPIDYANAYFGLLRDMEELFGRSIDLVETKAISNTCFRDAVMKTRRTVYAA